MIFKISNFYKSTFIISTSQITYNSDPFQNSTPKVPIFVNSIFLKNSNFLSNLISKILILTFNS